MTHMNIMEYNPEIEVTPDEMLVCQLQGNNRYLCYTTNKLDRIDDPREPGELQSEPIKELDNRFSYIISNMVPTQVRSRGTDRIILSSTDTFFCDKEDQQRDVGTSEESNIDILVCQPKAKPLTLLELLFPLH